MHMHMITLQPGHASLLGVGALMRLLQIAA
jgi:hypothetical protein